MSEFHFEYPDLKNSTLEKGFPSCPIEKNNFIDSQGKQIRTESKESFKQKFGNNGYICVVVEVAVLLAKGPYYMLRVRGRNNLCIRMDS